MKRWNGWGDDSNELGLRAELFRTGPFLKD